MSEETQYEWGVKVFNHVLGRWTVVVHMNEGFARRERDYELLTSPGSYRPKVVRRTVTRSEWDEEPSLEKETLSVLREAAEIACYNEPGPDCSPGDPLCLGCHAKALVKRHES